MGWRIEAAGGCIRLVEGGASAEICKLSGGYRFRYGAVSAEAYQPGDLYREVEDVGGRILARSVKLSDLVEFSVEGGEGRAVVTASEAALRQVFEDAKAAVNELAARIKEELLDALKDARVKYVSAYGGVAIAALEGKQAAVEALTSGQEQGVLLKVSKAKAAYLNVVWTDAEAKETAAKLARGEAEPGLFQKYVEAKFPDKAL
ncbi:MAG: hypothetical protein ACP5MH_09360 [Thermoproteus sp.]